jgi:hypothetical protein
MALKRKIDMDFLYDDFRLAKIEKYTSTQTFC